jgi:predicted RNase H-like HicB family nuclease
VAWANDGRFDVTRYLILIEPTETGFSAYSPDLPGCVSTGRTAVEVEANMREAVQGHLEEMRNAGLPIPKPTTAAGYVEVAA